MAHDDAGTTIGQNLLQCGQSAADAGVVSDVTILVQGYIEIHADDCLFASKFVLVDSHNNVFNKFVYMHLDIAMCKGMPFFANQTNFLGQISCNPHWEQWGLRAVHTYLPWRMSQW